MPKWDAGSLDGGLAYYMKVLALKMRACNHLKLQVKQHNILYWKVELDSFKICVVNVRIFAENFF